MGKGVPHGSGSRRQPGLEECIAAVTPTRRSITSLIEWFFGGDFSGRRLPTASRRYSRLQARATTEAVWLNGFWLRYDVWAGGEFSLST